MRCDDFCIQQKRKFLDEGAEVVDFRRMVNRVFDDPYPKECNRFVIFTRRTKRRSKALNSLSDVYLACFPIVRPQIQPSHANVRSVRKFGQGSLFKRAEKFLVGHRKAPPGLWNTKNHPCVQGWFTRNKKRTPRNVFAYVRRIKLCNDYNGFAASLSSAVFEVS